MTRIPVTISYRFGPFEARPASGELFNGGRKTRIQEQPFQLLILLLEKPGSVVTREEIRSRIWKGDTFVDFDSSVRVAVRKLRDALGDSAELPRFVETIPKRGYRFLAPVTQTKEDSGVPPFSPALPSAAAPVLPTVTRRHSLTAALILLVAVTLLSLTRRENPPAASAVIVADFANSTGDSVFDDALRQGVTVALEQSPALSVVSEERIQQTLRLMDRSDATRLTSDVAMNICTRTATNAVLDGSIARVGTQYVIGLRAIDCRGGDVLHAEQVQVARKEDVLLTVDRMASRFGARLGHASAARVATDPEIAEATTPSLQAWKAYSTGWRVSASKGPNAAIPFFKQATELDPGFAMAHAALGLEYSSNGEPTLAAESTTRAYELIDRVSDRERFFITAYYNGRVTGNQEKAKETCETWAQAYPHDPLPHNLLAGFIDIGLGKLETARDEARTSLDLNPDDGIAYQHLGMVQLYLGQPDETERVLRRAAERQLQSPLIAVLRYDLAFYRGDDAQMAAELAAAQASPETDDWLSQRQAFVAAYGGRLHEALNLAHRAEAIAGEAGQAERAALFAAPAALWQAWFGEFASSRAAAMASLASANSREVQFGAALALAVVGDSVESTRLADGLAARFPEDTGVQFSYVPTIRAAVSLKGHNPQRSLEQLDITRAYELAIPRSRIQGYFGALYPAYIRGEAYLAERRGPDAAAEFQKIIDRRGIVQSDPIGALAHLGLGRAYAMAGDRARARRAYDDFFALWKAADAGLPVLGQARTEYAALTR